MVIIQGMYEAKNKKNKKEGKLAHMKPRTQIADKQRGNKCMSYDKPMHETPKHVNPGPISKFVPAKLRDRRTEY